MSWLPKLYRLVLLLSDLIHCPVKKWTVHQKHAVNRTPEGRVYCGDIVTIYPPNDF